MTPSHLSNPASCADASITSLTCRSTDWFYDMGGVIPVVSSDALLFLYQLGLRLLEVDAGKNIG